ncbi:MAG: hypothetical protein WCW03_01835 [Candidatus Paceibacterota bacterium]|jgi:hypothetical protein
MSKAILWLSSKGFHVYHIESLDYAKFARSGKKYLRTIWNTKTFKIQDTMSDLKEEQKDATKLLTNKHITLLNNRLNINDIQSLFKIGFFIMLSINPNILEGSQKYGAHMVVVAGFKNKKVRLCDPDHGFKWYDESTVGRAMNKKDFSVTLISR